MQLSPLRDRKEDIEDLANYFIRQYSPEYETYSLSPEALQKLQNHNWPGNIRELENVIQRSLCFTDPGILKATDLQIDEFQPTQNSKICNNYEDFRNNQLNEERAFLLEKIKGCGGSVSAAAEKLGMLRTALYNRLNRLGVTIKDVK